MNVEAESLSFMFDSCLGGKRIDQILKEIFIKFYCNEVGISKTQLTEDILHQIEVFAYQNKSLLFQNYYKRKPTKLYFNFAYPAFQKTVSVEDLDQWIEPFAENIKDFISSLLNKTIYGSIGKEKVQKVIAVGGGFEMNWMKELLENEFTGIPIICPKESEGTVALGACIGAASYLGILPEQMIDLSDRHQLTSDIGIKGIYEKELRFIPLIERNTFWWQKSKPRIFILDLEGRNTLDIPIYKRNEQGEIIPIHTIQLKNLPERPSRTIRLKFSMEFRQYDQIETEIRDCGFGELFPASDFAQKFIIGL